MQMPLYSHPVRYLLVDGLLHTTKSTDLFCPAINQFPSHLAPDIPSALQSQQSIGWNNTFKGYFSKHWAKMAQVDMHNGSQGAKKGASRMKQIITAIGDHTRRLWLVRNAVLHTKDDEQLAAILRSSEFAQIEHYHSNPQLLHTGDQHYCQQPLSKQLSSCPVHRLRGDNGCVRLNAGRLLNSPKMARDNFFPLQLKSLIQNISHGFCWKGVPHINCLDPSFLPDTIRTISH